MPYTCMTEAGIAALFIHFSTACLFFAKIMCLLKLQTIQHVVNQQTDADVKQVHANSLKEASGAPV